jgi:hypothetical protein
MHLQDATVKLWERREMAQKSDDDKRKKKSWFANKASSRDSKSYQWFCNSTFEPKSEAVRDIQWSNFRDDSKNPCVPPRVCCSSDVTVV